MPSLTVRLTAAIGLFFGLVFPTAAFDGLIDEARFGGTWAQPDWLDSGHPEDHQFGINAEILFIQLNWDMRDNPPDDFLNALAMLRVHVGGMLNFDDDGTDYVYTGLTWDYNLTKALFVELGLGLN